MKPVAVEGMTISYGTSSVEQVSLGEASEKLSVDGNGAYAGNLTISVSGASMGTYSQGEGQSTFSPSSLYSSIDGQKLLLEGDIALIQVIGINTATEPPSPIEWTITATIQDAGQSVLLAE